jgi:hypothetical protein
MFLAQILGGGADFEQGGIRKNPGKKCSFGRYKNNRFLPSADSKAEGLESTF